MNNDVKVIIKNRRTSIKDSYKDTSTKRVIISISSTAYRFPYFNKSNPAVKAILYLSFDDVLDNEEFYGCSAISNEDAFKIVNFVNNSIGTLDIDAIEVHCDAGVSRSAGVGAAILKYLKGDDSEIFDNPYFCPNDTCYKKVLNMFFRNS